MEKINLIFDLDGTLVDSYDSITEWFYEVMLHFGFDFNKDRLRVLCLTHNLDYGMNLLANENNINIDELYTYSKTIKEKIEYIKAFPYACELVSNPKFNCFIYTHRGKTTPFVLKNTNLENKFIEVVTSLNIFPRKPSPEAIFYLIDKYKLDKHRTYYVGDRPMDIDVGINADIKTIFVKTNNLNIDTSKASYVVSCLKDIEELDL